jgi:hypothetical protein
MATVRFPQRIAVTVDENASGPVSARLLAWKNVEVADAGHVAVYELVEEFETVDVKKKRRLGTKNWFY